MKTQLLALSFLVTFNTFAGTSAQDSQIKVLREAFISAHNPTIEEVQTIKEISPGWGAEFNFGCRTYSARENNMDVSEREKLGFSEFGSALKVDGAETLTDNEKQVTPLVYTFENEGLVSRIPNYGRTVYTILRATNSLINGTTVLIGEVTISNKDAVSKMENSISMKNYKAVAYVLCKR